MSIKHLLNKPHVNGVTLREQKLSLKSFQDYEFVVCFYGGLDLSKNLQRVSVDAVKLQAVKLWGRSHRPGLNFGPHMCGAWVAECQNFF